MGMPPSDGPGRNIGDEHNDFLALDPGDWLPQQFGPCDLRRRLRTEVCGSQCTDSHPRETDGDQQEGLPHVVSSFGWRMGVPLPGATPNIPKADSLLVRRLGPDGLKA